MDCIALRRAHTRVGSFGRMKMDCIALARCTHTGAGDPNPVGQRGEVRFSGASLFPARNEMSETNFVAVKPCSPEGSESSFPDPLAHPPRLRKRTSPGRFATPRRLDGG